MFESALKWLTAFLTTHQNSPLGFALLFASALTEYVFPPFPGDTVTLFSAVLVAHHHWSLVGVFAALTCGSIAGCGINYGVGIRAARRYQAGSDTEAPSRMRRAIDRVLEAFKRYGPAYVAINRFLPGIRAVIFVAAGMARLPLVAVMVYATLSAVVWNVLVFAVGYGLGANWQRIQSTFSNVGTVAALVVVAIVVGVCVLAWRATRGDSGADDA